MTHETPQLPPQAKLFKAETTWFHVFKTMVDSGDLAKIGPYAFTVYCVIKSHTNFSTGRAFPAIETIVEKSGISQKQVRRSIDALEEHGYITKVKTGRSNTYTLREKVEILDDAGRTTAVATWDYLPAGVQQSVGELRRVLITGDFEGAKIINIERLIVNINNGPGDQTNVSVQDAQDRALRATKDIKDAAIRETVAGLIHRRGSYPQGDGK